MWLKTGLVCGLVLALLVKSPRADIDCDGVDDLLTTGLPLATFITAAAFTVAGWVKIQSTPTTATHCYEGSVLTGDTDAVLSLGRLSPSEFCSEAYDASEHRVIGTATPGWHHLAVSLGGGTLTLYVDGNSTATDAMAPLENFTLPVTLCGMPSGFTADRLAEMAYYPTAIPAGELASKAASRLRGNHRTVPSAYWPLDDCPEGGSGNGVSFKDRSGNNRHATGTNGGGTCRATEYLSRPMPVQ